MSEHWKVIELQNRATTFLEHVAVVAVGDGDKRKIILAEVSIGLADYIDDEHRHHLPCCWCRCRRGRALEAAAAKVSPSGSLGVGSTGGSVWSGKSCC